MSKNPFTDNLTTANQKYSFPLQSNNGSQIVSFDEYSEDFLDETVESKPNPEGNSSKISNSKDKGSIIQSENESDQYNDSFESSDPSLNIKAKLNPKIESKESSVRNQESFNSQEAIHKQTPTLKEIETNTPQNQEFNAEKSHNNQLSINGNEEWESGILDDSSSYGDDVFAQKIAQKAQEIKHINKNQKKNIDIKPIASKKSPAASNRTPEAKRSNKSSTNPKINNSDENLNNPQERSNSYSSKRPQNPESRVKEINQIMNSDAVKNRNSWIYVLEQLKNPRILTKIVAHPPAEPKRYSSCRRGKISDHENFSSNECLSTSSKPRSFVNTSPFRSPYGIVQIKKPKLSRFSKIVKLAPEKPAPQSQKSENVPSNLPQVDWKNTVLDSYAISHLFQFNSENDIALFTEHEIFELAKRPWSDGPEVSKILLKARITLDKLKLELLIDTLPTFKTLKALSKACKKLLIVRKTILKILHLIHKREDLLKTLLLEHSKNQHLYQQFLFLGNKLITNLQKYKKFHLFNPKFLYNSHDYTIKLYSDNTAVAQKISAFIASSNNSSSNLS
ncbi:unnamed protein product [Blepharisma stoltei]|uniref:Uncharacterized protein n=1 Tax=Blepharisma stoltei TaxID=1481888 RepID=A0AAU9IFD6_9CILI|nr:unnamed protein product [Blepharisma stoltei]